MSFELVKPKLMPSLDEEFRPAVLASGVDGLPKLRHPAQAFLWSSGWNGPMGRSLALKRQSGLMIIPGPKPT